MLKRIQEQGAAPVRRERMTPKEKAESDIAQHRAKIEEAPDSEDAPAYWNAMGNLYAQKLGNYNEAIRCYEIVLSDFPDWPNIRGVYVKLADCYERIGETTKAQRVYRNMMRDFAPDRPEHQYAKQKLGM